MSSITRRISFPDGRGGASANSRLRTASLAPAQQVAQEFHRKVEAKAEDLDQLVVAFGMGDHAGISRPRKNFALAFFRQPADDPCFRAAIDDDVGDRFGPSCPAGPKIASR